jgi:hypothetical protein
MYERSVYYQRYWDLYYPPDFTSNSTFFISHQQILFPFSTLGYFLDLQPCVEDGSFVKKFINVFRYHKKFY